MNVTSRSLRRVLVATVCVAGCLVACSAGRPASGRLLPSDFRDDRVFLVVADRDRAPLTFYTDSGGGFNAITASTAARLGLPRIGSIPREADQAEQPLVAFPLAMTAAGMPPSAPRGPFQGGLVVVPDADFPFATDGFLGGRWFDGHVWQFDYVARTLRLLDDAPPLSSTHGVPLGFQTDADGRRTSAFARLPVTVDGERLDMLLDTGATATLTPNSAPTFHREDGTQIGSSFIVQSVFERWTRRHPDWKVIPDGDAIGRRRASMIEVPHVTIANFTVGPVWFAVRPDANFRVFMTKMMDGSVDGAVGGSAFHDLRLTIDYPRAIVSFEMPPGRRSP